jgi:Cu/Zn superoxide dismutase
VATIASTTKYVYPMAATAELLSGFMVTGAFEFKQQTPESPTVITFSATGQVGTVETNFGEYHIHEYPINPALDTPEARCQLPSVGGHWKRDGDVNEYPCTSFEKCEVGDLSGKFGDLDGSYIIDKVVTDSSLDMAEMFDHNNEIGKSIVIHDLSGDRWVCGTLVLRSGRNGA